MNDANDAFAAHTPVADDALARDEAINRPIAASLPAVLLHEEELCSLWLREVGAYETAHWAIRDIFTIKS